MTNIVPSRLLLYSLPLLSISQFLWFCCWACHIHVLMGHRCLCATASGTLQSPLYASGFICLFAFDASPQVFLWSLVLTLDTHSTTHRPWLPPSLPAWPFLCLGSSEQSPSILRSVCHQEGHVLGAPRASPVKVENSYLVELGLLMPITFLPFPRFQSKVIIVYTWFGKKENLLVPRMQRSASELGIGLTAMLHKLRKGQDLEHLSESSGTISPVPFL